MVGGGWWSCVGVGNGVWRYLYTSVEQHHSAGAGPCKWAPESKLMNRITSQEEAAPEGAYTHPVIETAL